MATTPVIVWGRNEQELGRFPVERRVVRIGSAADSDIVLESTGLAANVLTINFSGQNGGVTVFSRTEEVESIGSSPAKLNQGVAISIGDRIRLVGGNWLELTTDSSTRRRAASAAVAKPVVREETVVVPSSKPRPTNVSEPVAGKKNSSVALPVAVLCVMTAALIGFFVWTNLPGNPSSSANVSLIDLVEMLADEKDADLKIVREEILKSWKSSDAEIRRQHVQNARNILIRRLGKNVFSPEVDMTKQASFNERSELQLFVLLSEI